jgi:hypothetical protein
MIRFEKDVRTPKRSDHNSHFAFPILALQESGTKGDTTVSIAAAVCKNNEMPKAMDDLKTVSFMMMEDVVEVFFYDNIP